MRAVESVHGPGPGSELGCRFRASGLRAKTLKVAPAEVGVPGDSAGAALLRRGIGSRSTLIIRAGEKSMSPKPRL